MASNPRLCVCRTMALFVATLVLVPLQLAAAEKPSPAQSVKLTFYGWSDQHVQTNGDGSHLVAAIDAMNALPGRRFPDKIEGVVSKPAFVFGCGDITEWPTRAARDTYDQFLTDRLAWPSYDVLGNHDDGGRVNSETMRQWLIRRHGALSYKFDASGITFLALYSRYDENLNSPAQPLTNKALGWLRGELEGLPKDSPVIVAMHLCFDALTNRDALVDTLGDANVLMVLGGHYHKAQVDRYRGIDFVQLPSPAPKNSTHEVTVVRVTPNRVVAIPYNYQRQAWVTETDKVLDKKLVNSSSQSPPAT